MTVGARSVAVVVALAAGVASADELTVDQLAEIQHQQEKAAKAFDDAPGAKDPKGSSREDRAELARKRAAADQAVLDKFGVDAKSVERAKTRLGRDDRAALKSKVETLEAKEKAAKAAPSNAERAPEDVEVQVGNGQAAKSGKPEKPAAPPKKPGRRR